MAAKKKEKNAKKSGKEDDDYDDDDDKDLTDAEKDARDYQLQRGIDMVIAMSRVRDGLSFVPATPEDAPAVASDDKDNDKSDKKDDKKSEKKK